MDYEAQRSLVERHGWFGRLALAFGRGKADGFRRSVVGGADRLGLVFMAVGAAAVLAFVGGLVVAVLAVIKWRQGELESGFDKTAGGDAYLEASVVFVGGFLFLLLMSLLMFGIGAEATSGALAFEQVLMWALVGAAFWPLVRGVPWGRFRWEIGLHAGDGVGREIWCGVLGYLAGVPLYVGVAVVLGFIESLAGGGEDAGPTGCPLFEPPPGESPWLLALHVLSLVAWAPFVEEMIFRGAMHRWLHARVRWLGAVAITAALFGLVHPYSAAGLVQVGVAGVVFGLLREWRGSLIAPIVAHALHNGLIAAVTVAIVAALG